MIAIILKIGHYILRSAHLIEKELVLLYFIEELLKTIVHYYHPVQATVGALLVPFVDIG